MSQHPKYADMILTAAKALGGKGASRQAINKYIVKEFNLTENRHHHAMLNQALKRCSAPKGTLVHSKGKGAAGSFKVRSAVPDSKTKKAAVKPKQDKKKPAKKTSPKKASQEKPKETKPASKPEAVKSAPSKPKAPKVKKSKKSKAASPKKPKVVKAKKAPKKAATKKIAKK